jgi:hypothetical protein
MRFAVFLPMKCLRNGEKMIFDLASTRQLKHATHANLPFPNVVCTAKAATTMCASSAKNIEPLDVLINSSNITNDNSIKNKFSYSSNT